MFYWLQSLYHWFDLTRIVHGVLWSIKNIRMVISLLTPPPKSSVEHLRGNVLKIHVDGGKSTIMLTFSYPPKEWNKVSMITVDALKAPLQPVENEKFNYRNYVFTDVTDEIAELAGPGKDFYGSRLCPHNIDRDYGVLIFHYGRGLKIYHAEDVFNL